jgi:hypothetical protein
MHYVNGVSRSTFGHIYENLDLDLYSGLVYVDNLVRIALLVR